MKKRLSTEQKKKLKNLVHTISKHLMFMLTLIEKILNIFGF